MMKISYRNFISVLRQIYIHALVTKIQKHVQPVFPKGQRLQRNADENFFHIKKRCNFGPIYFYCATVTDIHLHCLETIDIILNDSFGKTIKLLTMLGSFYNFLLGWRSSKKVSHNLMLIANDIASSNNNFAMI